MNFLKQLVSVKIIYVGSDRNHIVDDINPSIFKHLKDSPTSEHGRFELITKDMIRSSFNYSPEHTNPRASW